ncbi:hypothetical protein QBC47DRAFT_109111 [Echria macrotheca]|uniref:Uncharacterized protein n=1 Tax=Echria macrotheca TaxID=438768 RepID=A0AAJ0BJU0_9PEZI|nr:hypothetical protein QBC47DRAFT_109111 [Echria macrotheca]
MASRATQNRSCFLSIVFFLFSTRSLPIKRHDTRPDIASTLVFFLFVCYPRLLPYDVRICKKMKRPSTTTRLQGCLNAGLNKAHSGDIERERYAIAGTPSEDRPVSCGASVSACNA